jgi:hypothetical protein
VSNEGLDLHRKKNVSDYSVNQNDDSNSDELLRGISTGKITILLPAPSPQSAVKREEGHEQGDHSASLVSNGK